MGLLVAVVVGVVLLAVLGYAVAVYNRLVNLRNRFKNAFAQIDVQLKRRYDLIPNLVETAKGYLSHERGTLEAVTQARNLAVGARAAAAQKPGDPTAMRALGGAESSLSGALAQLFAVSEAYPELRAQQTMRELSEDLRSTENKVAFARQHFNDSVTEYNTHRESFPAVVFASALNFSPAELLAAIGSEGERQAPRVEF